MSARAGIIERQITPRHGERMPVPVDRAMRVYPIPIPSGGLIPLEMKPVDRPYFTVITAYFSGERNLRSCSRCVSFDAQVTLAVSAFFTACLISRRVSDLGDGEAPMKCRLRCRGSPVRDETTSLLLTLASAGRSPKRTCWSMSKGSKRVSQKVLWLNGAVSDDTNYLSPDNMYVSRPATPPTERLSKKSPRCKRLRDLFL